MEYSDTYDAVETCAYCGAPMIPVIGDDAGHVATSISGVIELP